ncbi:adenylate/guanylate cyclase domain-containing protein [Hoeflea sp. CAU 1731]
MSDGAAKGKEAALSKVAVSERSFAEPVAKNEAALVQQVKSSAVVFGIKAKLLLSFIALAACTLIACIVAWTVFSHIQRAVTNVTSDSLPKNTLALTIAEHSAEIYVSAPSIMASESQSVLEFRKKLLDDAVMQLNAAITQWRDIGMASDIAGDLTGKVERISGYIDEVNLSVANMLDITDALHGQVDKLSQTHGQFLEVLEPLIDDAVFNLVIENESTTSKAEVALRETLTAETETLGALLALKNDLSIIDGPLANDSGLENSNLQHFSVDEFSGIREHIADHIRTLRLSASANELEFFNDSVQAFVVGLGSYLTRAAGSQDSGPDTVARQDLARIHADLLKYIDPLILQTRERLLTRTFEIFSQQSSKTMELIDLGANTIHNLLTIRSDGNLAAGLLNEASNVQEPERLEPLGERFRAAAGQIERSYRQLPEQNRSDELRMVIDSVLSIGHGDDSIFRLRGQELVELEHAQNSISASGDVSQQLVIAVTRLVEETEQDANETARHADETIRTGKIEMLIIAGASLIGSALIMLIFVGPRIIRPIREITDTMTDLAAGDTTVVIPGTDRNDELGKMSKALEVFRDITISIQESNLKEIDLARRRLADAIESISEAFSLYDAQDRLVVCNQKYGTLVHPEIADEIHPGLFFEQIVRRSIELGLISEAIGREEEWLKERVKRHRHPEQPHIMHRHDGTWIMVSERRTADGGVVAVYSDITEMKERENELAEKSIALEQLSKQLSKYLSPQVYQSIFSGEQSAIVASKRKKLTVFFSDLVGFTEIADRLESEDLTQILNQYLTEMTSIALDHGATIDKYIGDSLMIFFGDPVSRGVQADAVTCVKMAIAMQKRLRSLSEEWRTMGLTEKLECRIGIATGFCTVGNFGSEDRMDYTIIGGTVNLASRLEGVTAPGTTLVAAETYSLIQDAIVCEEHETVAVKGIAYPVHTYRVIDTKEVVAKRGGPVSRKGDRITIDADIDSMSEEERREVSEMLQKILSDLNPRTT